MLRPFLVALSFLTRLPVRVQDVQETELGGSTAYFPAVGLALGLALAAAEGAARAHVSPDLVAVGLVSLLVALTGGLHLDGLADVFDGLGGSRGDRERMLTIMRDSRIGSLGGAALVLLLLGKVFATVEVVKRGDPWPLLVFPMASRWAVVPLVIFFPCARREGLGRAFKGHGRPIHVALATAFTAVVVGVAGVRAIVGTAAGLTVALVFGLWLYRRLGGLTGDVYGAAIELSELAFLIAAVPLDA